MLELLLFIMQGILTVGTMTVICQISSNCVIPVVHNHHLTFM